MSYADAATYKTLGDWFSAPQPGLIPKEGMGFNDQETYLYRQFFSPHAGLSLSGFRLDGSRSEDNSAEILCDCVNLPLIVAFQSGITGQGLVDIARHHEVNTQSLLYMLDSMVITDYVFYDRGGESVSLSKLCIECIKAVSIAFPEALSTALREMLYPAAHLNLASIHSENPDHWPATRLADHMKAIEAEKGAVRLSSSYYAMNDMIRDFVFDGYMLTDSTGPRYDLYLERSGMLLPEVITKKVHPLSLWEDMVKNAKGDSGKGLSGLFNYCINSAHPNVRPAIAKALQCMTSTTANFFKANYWQYMFLTKKLHGTWLETHVQTPRLLINLVSDDNFEIVLEKLREQGIEYVDHADDFADLVKAPDTLNQWLEDIMATEPQELSLSHFNIFRLENYEMPEQTFSNRWRPEEVIRHMLEGMELFVAKNVEEIPGKRKIDGQAFDGCVYVTKTLASRHELDYKAFSGASSLSIRVLAEAGLDKRRLPRMNYKDKGILVSAELGL
jgi:hypothetical protein